MIGRVIKGKYHILREIGADRASAIYLAMNLNTNQVVTLKVLHAELTGEGQFMARFRRDVKLLDKLNSRHALRLLDYGEEDGLTFVVQEYVSGRTLDQVLREEGPLDIGRALSIVRQVGECLADAGMLGLVHRDLHPEDIVLTVDDTVKVTGFGLAAGMEFNHLAASDRVGLPYYLAPELAEGQAAGVRADVYSLGAILFEIITGQVPYPGNDVASVVWKHLNEPVPSVRRLRAEAPEGLDGLLAQCLAKDPKKRPLPAALVGSIADLFTEAHAPLGTESSLVGQTLGHYQLLERIGQGGMAAVYKAYQPGLDRHVAVKVLPPYFAHEPNFAARFEREAKAIARLDHPNILPVYDFGREGDLTYIVMRYVQGGTLKDLLGQPLSLERTVDIISQVAAALDEAHHEGILHRDVKPSNVLVARPNWMLLSDFGLAQIIESSTRITRSGASVGTPAYMSPEQGRGLPVDARSDVYSLGVVVFEMLTGRVPYDADTPIAILIQHITAALPRPTEFNPDIPGLVEGVILKALAKEPAERFQSAGELAAALRQAVEIARTQAKLPVVQEATRPDLPAVREPVVVTEGKRSFLGGPGRWLGVGSLAVAGLLVVMGLVVFLVGRTLWSGGTPSPTPIAWDVGPMATMAAANTLVPLMLTQTNTAVASNPVPSTSTRAETPVPPTPTPTLTAVPFTSTWTPTTVRRTATRTLTSAPATATWTPTPMPATSTRISTPVPPTPTQTFTPAPPTSTWTLTPVPPTPTATNTPVPPTATLTFTPEPPTPTATDTPMPVVATDTSVPPAFALPKFVPSIPVLPQLVPSLPIIPKFMLPQGSPTMVPTETATATDTSMPTATSTAIATPTDTATSTSTPIPPTATPTSTATPASTPTSAATPTRTPTPRPARITTANITQIGLLRTLQGLAGSVYNLAFSPDATVLAAGLSGNTVRMWQVSTGASLAGWGSDREALRTREGYAVAVESMALSPDLAVLASGGKYWNKVVWLWSTRDGTLLHTLGGHSSSVESVAFSPDGKVLASGSYDDTIRLWRMSDGNALRVLEGHTASVTSLAFSPDGSLVASGAGDKTARLWRVGDGSLLRTLEGYTGSVDGVAFSPDGATLATGASYPDNTIRLWRVRDGALLNTLEGHAGSVTSLAFSPDGMVLASGSADNTMRLWRVPEGDLLGTLQGHTDQVLTVAFSPDGMVLASGSQDKTVRLWGVGASAPGEPPACTDDAVFLADVTVPDNTVFKPGEGFGKTWRVKNSGTCSWDAGYRLAFGSGDKMGATEAQVVARTEPGGTADVTAALVAPIEPGTYAGVWQLMNAKGEPFGQKLTVVIQVQPANAAAKTWTRPEDGMVMVYVPVGEFVMGSNDGDSNERPVHPVALDAFWLDRTEVTNAQYHRCMQSGVCTGGKYENKQSYDSDSQPVVGVLWNDAITYCRWAGVRLPTEAEWEYAARGSEGRIYPWGNTFDGKRLDYCDINCFEPWADKTVNDGYDIASPVGSYPNGASWCGALDMAGNAWEWVADWYGSYSSQRQVNPTGPASGQRRVLRGGLWISPAGDVRGAARAGGDPLDWAGIGFRCAKNAQ